MVRLIAQIEYFARQGRMVVPVDLAATAQREAGTSRHSLPPIPVVSPIMPLMHATSSRVTTRPLVKRARQAHCP